MFDKKLFKEIFREFNFSHIITIHKGYVFYRGAIDGYKVTKNYDNFDECLEATRKILEELPEWVDNLINPKKSHCIRRTK